MGDLKLTSASGSVTLSPENVAGTNTLTIPSLSGGKTLLTTDGDGSSLTGIITDTTIIENNIAMLAFYRASDNSKAKYNLVDQVIDEYQDATGVDTSASTGETAGGSGSSKYYYGSVTVTPTVTGGTITTDGDYKVHTFTSNGTYDSNYTQDVDIMVLAGGGSGGSHGGAGGGAGGLIYTTGYSLSDAAHTISIGSGGTGATGTSNTAGDDSSIGSLLVAKGGGKGVTSANNPSAAEPYNGGSGAGSGHQSKTFTGTQTSQSGDSGTYGFGNDGGTGYVAGDFAGGGGGGAGSVGSNATSGLVGGNGGSGKTLSISGSSVTYAGGGGGSHHDGGGSGSGGSGGGGNGTGFGQNGGNATGYGSGGGGGGKDCTKGGNGSVGIVIIRRAISSTSASDLVLQSNDTTAEAAPTTGDMVTLIEDAAGTATLNTDIKGYVSRDSGTTWTQGTLTDEGSWGTNKKVLAFHNLDISSQPSGTSMKYKITTHNQSGSKETRIHATSLAWA